MVRRSRLLASALAVLSAFLFAGIGTAVSATAATADAPLAAKDHWHAAFGIWNCGTWEAPVASEDDPTGIHTHGDGLIHIHPFDKAAAGKNAILQKFFDVTGVKITAAAVSIPGRPAIKVGGNCKGEKSVVRTLVWSNINSKTPKVFKVDPGLIGLRDGQLSALVVGGPNANPGLPPSSAELVDPADLPPPELTAKELAALPAVPAKPKPAFTGAAPKTFTMTDVAVGAGSELKTGMRAYVRLVAYLWRSGEVLADEWSTSQPAALARLGKKRNLPGIEKGVLGMKVGGVRRLVLPPADGFGTSGNGAVKGDDTIVFDVQLVAVAK
jgi:hypothetical protein